MPKQSTRQTSLKRHFDKVDVSNEETPQAKAQVNTTSLNPKPEQTSSNEQDLPTPPTAMDIEMSDPDEEEEEEMILSPAPITPGMTSVYSLSLRFCFAFCVIFSSFKC